MADRDSNRPGGPPGPEDPSVVATHSAGIPQQPGTIVGDGPAIVPGQVLDGKYRIDRKIAAGGMGAVWQGTHLHLQAPIAIKVLIPELREQPQAIERFWHEARMMGGLGHPNIVRVLDVSSPVAPLPYIVMEMLPGESLRARMRRTGRLSIAEACVVLDGVLTALVVAHRQGIVHRDLKPENIFLVPRADDDQGPGFYVKVLDFGASKLTDEDRDPHLTHAGGFLGTPMYMAPEQAGGGTITHRCDLYSAGVVFYEMISSQLPHTADNLQALMFKLATEEATPITTHMADVHPLVHRFLSTALAHEPTGRFDTAESMRKALRSVPRGRGSMPEMLSRDAALAYRSALSDVEESGEVDLFPTLSPIEPAVQALRSTHQTTVAVDDPRSTGPAEAKIELDLPADMERNLAPKRRSSWPILVVLLIALAPAYVVWSMARDDAVAPLEAELAEVVSDPRGVRDGRLRAPREIEPDLAAARSEALRNGGVAWAGAGLVGLVAWWVIGRRR